MSREGQGRDSGHLAGHWLGLKERCTGRKENWRKGFTEEKAREKAFNAFFTGKKAASPVRAQIRGVNSTVTGS